MLGIEQFKKLQEYKKNRYFKIEGIRKMESIL